MNDQQNELLNDIKTLKNQVWGFVQLAKVDSEMFEHIDQRLRTLETQIQRIQNQIENAFNVMATKDEL